MLDKLAIGHTPDFDVTSSQLLSRRLEDRRIGAKLDRMAMRGRKCQACHNPIAADDEVFELRMHVGKCLEVAAYRCLGACKSLAGAAVMLSIVFGNDVAKGVDVVGIEFGHIAVDERRARVRSSIPVVY